MNKIINYTLLFLLLLSSCAYEPVLNNKNYEFSINVDKINGDQKINSIIIENFYRFQKNNELLNIVNKSLWF